MIKKTAFAFLLSVILSSQLSAQFVKEKSIDVSIGLGISLPYDDVDVNSLGGYLQGEYVLTLAKWIDIRPYAGFIFTKTNTDDNQTNGIASKANSTAFLLGGKIKLLAPIPWVAPYIEVGVGASIGSFETVTPFTSIDESGFFYHIPFSIGLQLGPNRNYDLAFSYYFHPEVEQVAGAFAVGISIPLRN
jgi:hypothetical protein